MFEVLGGAAIPPLKAIVEDLAAKMPTDPIEEHRSAGRVRQVLALMKATGAPQLAEAALQWSRETPSTWLRQELLAFFSLETGEPGLAALLDQLRVVSGGGPTNE